jgi:hypothetical protein
MELITLEEVKALEARFAELQADLSTKDGGQASRRPVGCDNMLNVGSMPELFLFSI